MTPAPGLEGPMPAGSVVITPTQMYAEMRRMGEKLDHLASVLDPALTTIRQDMATTAAQGLLRDGEIRQVQNDHESRLRSLDKRIWVAAVLAASTGAGLAQLGTFLGQ